MFRTPFKIIMHKAIMTPKSPTSEQTQSEEAHLLSQVGHWAVGIGWRSLERQRQMPEVECRGWSRLWRQLSWLSHHCCALPCTEDAFVPHSLTSEGGCQVLVL